MAGKSTIGTANCYREGLKQTPDGGFEHEQMQQTRPETSQLRDKTGPGGVTKVGLQVYEMLDTVGTDQENTDAPAKRMLKFRTGGEEGVD